ncbi:PKD domain-containing protein, partial [Flammeovirga pacifica]
KTQYPLKSERESQSGFYFKKIDGLEIEGLTFKSDSISTKKINTILTVNSVISIDSCTNVSIHNIIAESDTIKESTFEMYASANLKFRGVHHVVIDSVYLEGAFSNIAFTTNDSSTNVEVSASTFEHSAFDLLGRLQLGDKFYIHDCDFLSRRHFGATNHIYLHGNPVDLKLPEGYLGDVVIRNNYFNGENSASNTKCIYLQYFDDAIIEDNDLLGGYYAIFVVSGDSVVINRNKIVTDVYKNIECGGNNKYYLTNNTFISHNASYNIHDQYTYEELVIANNTFYRQEIPTHTSASFLYIDTFQGDSLAIVNNLFVMADTLDNIIRLEDFKQNLDTSTFTIDHNVVVKSNDTAHFNKYYYFRNMEVGDDNDVDSSFVSLEDWQNFHLASDQNSYVTSTHNFTYLPSPATESRLFIDSADFHMNDGTTFRKGTFLKDLPTDRDGDPRTELAGVDIGADQYYLGTQVAFETCDEDLTSQITEGHKNITSYLWYFGDGATSIEMTPTHTYEAMGEYTVSLVTCDVTNYCDSVSFKVNIEDQNCKFEDPTFSLIDQTSFVVYPNPTKGHINFSSYEIAGPVNAQLVDMNGAILYEGYEELNQLGTEISQVLSQLQSGIYVLKIEQEGNNYTKRIVLGE